MRFVKAADNAQRSKPHRKMEEHLQEQGISFMSEHPFPPYAVDIYLPEWHLAIEIDGPLHSSKKDDIRDIYLKNIYGVHILHIGFTNMTGGAKKEVIQDRVIKFIEQNAATVEDRKAIWLSRP